jgi:putative redox protein
MEHHTTVTYVNGLSFDVELDNHHFLIDADEKYGGKDKGPKPKKLMLAALAGCTGMDTVSILRKMKMPFDSFWVETEADLNEESEPKVYTSFMISFCFKGKELQLDKIQKAVELSQQKYCGVTAMFRSFASIEYDIKLNP